jgi:GNAT superfamily N-acetyltransferase
MNNIIIKPASESDVPIILSFINKLAEYERLSHEVTATEEVLRNNLFNGSNNAEAILCYENNIPVGFALFFHNFSTFLGKKGLYLEDLYVLPEYRSKGIGKKMLRYLAKLAVERNCGRFEWSVLDWNEPAIKFYRNLGAEFKNEWIITRVSGDALKKLAE